MTVESSGGRNDEKRGCAPVSFAWAGRFLWPRGLVRWLGIGVLSANLFVGGILGAVLYQSETRFQEDARVNVENLSRVLESNVEDLISRIDLTLQAVSDEKKRQQGIGEVNWAELDAFLTRHADRNSDIAGLRVTGADGIIKIAAKSVRLGGIVNIADREYFMRLRDDPQADLFISQMVLSRIDQTAVIVLARRLADPEGGFAGIVSATVEAERFSELFSHLEVGPNGAVVMRDGNFNEIVRHPRIEPTGIDPTPASAMFRASVAANPTAGCYRTKAGPKHISQMISYRRVGRYPLYLITVLAEDDYLAAWKREALQLGSLGVLFVSLTLAFFWLVRRSLVRLGSAVDALRDSEESFRTMADYTYDWEYWLGPDQRMLYVTPSCEQLTGYLQTEFLENPRLLVDIVYPEDKPLMQAYFDNPTHDDMLTATFRILRKDGETRWISHASRIVTWSDGRFMGRRASNHDVTERKRAETDLLEKSRDLAACRT